MKKTLLRLLGLSWMMCPVLSEAFFPQSEFERLEKKVLIQVHNEQAHVEILEKITNITPDPKHIELFHSLPQGARDIQFFIDARGESYETFQHDEKLNHLFSKAATYKDARFFRYALPTDDQLFQSTTLEIGGEQTILSKVTYDYSITPFEDFFHLPLWDQDDIMTLKAEIVVTINTDVPIKHFFSTLPSEELFDQTEKQVTLLFQKDAFNPNTDINFFWSHAPEPILSFNVHRETYLGHFLPPSPPREIEEITFLIDQSGSLYGAPWERVQEYIQFWLDHIGSDKRIRIIFFDEGIEFLRADFTQNTKEFRQLVFDALRSIKPHKKTDISTALNQVSKYWDNANPNQALILVTDFEERFDIPDPLPAPIIVLDFSSDSSLYLKILAQKTGGFYQKFFRTPWQLIESAELWDQWTNWREPISHELVHPLEFEREIFPLEVRSIANSFSPVFIGRKETNSPLPSNTITHFLPQTWAAKRMAENLKTYDFENDDILYAILAVGRTFGIKTNFFDEHTSYEELKQTLYNLQTDESLNRTIEQNLLELQNPNRFNFSSNARFADSIPSYEENPGHWRQFNFLDLVKPNTWIEIEPFSEAQKQLFLSFPDMVSEGFGMANQTEFCTPFRCISVLHEKRTEPLRSDRAFFRDFDSHHWALPYLIELVNHNVLQPEPNGKLHPNRPIDRGDFAKMLVEYLWTTDHWKSPIPIPFEDTRATEWADAVNLLVHKKVIQGYKDGTFRPLQSLSRAEAVKILLATSGFIPHEDELLAPPRFEDANGWEKPWVNEAVERGIVRGFDDGTFRPHQKLTKAEGAKLVVELKKDLGW